MAWVRSAARLVTFLALAALVACSATESQQRNPTAPSAATASDTAQTADATANPDDPDAAGITAVGATTPDGLPRPNAAPSGSMGGVPLPPSGADPSDVNFPPRNEPLLFRTALEAKYRDGLRRGQVQTYVDQEGTVVWTQEYLRYRVNLCSHPDAVFRVFRQIDGFGIQPVCGSTTTVVFPPRNEPYDFMIQLEDKYRTSLGRSPGSSYVDIEGNIVWTQEYLRYRVSGCGHVDAQQRVFDQIDGRGVQPDCTGGGGGGGNRTVNGNIEPLGAGYYDVSMTATGRFQATLRWADASIDLDLYLTTTACGTYPPTGNCLLAVSDGVGVNSEQVSWNVRAGERYYLWVDNFTDRGTAYTIEQFIIIAGGGAQPTASPGTALRPVGSRSHKAKR